MKLILIATLSCALLMSCTKPTPPVYKTVQAQPVVIAQPVKPATPENATAPVQQMQVVELNESNTVVLDQSFTTSSVTRVMLDIQALSSKLGKNDTIYLVLDTPGGSVDAGLRLISFIKALPQRVTTLTLFAASMGFQTVQGLDERLILDTGTVMSHRARFGCQGEAEGEIEACMSWIMNMINVLDDQAAKRMSMTPKAYKELIRDEYWAYGQKAVNDKAVDRAVLAKCGKGMGGTRVTTVETMFGNFKVEVSKCPLIPGILSVVPADELAKTAKPEAIQYVKMMYANKKAFVEDYVVNNKWMEFQK